MDEKKVQEEIARTLAALDHRPHVQATPFFYTRLKARMQTQPSAGVGMLRFVHDRVFVAVAGLVLLVAVNIFAFAHLSARSSEAQKEQTLASFAQEYNLSSSQY